MNNFKQSETHLFNNFLQQLVTFIAAIVKQQMPMTTTQCISCVERADVLRWAAQAIWPRCQWIIVVANDTANAQLINVTLYATVEVFAKRLNDNTEINCE